jgi:hypothetical protein
MIFLMRQGFRMGLNEDVMSTGIPVRYFWTGRWVLPRLGFGWAVRESHEWFWGAGVWWHGNQGRCNRLLFRFHVMMCVR